jgi:hypothetical protein
MKLHNFAVSAGLILVPFNLAIAQIVPPPNGITQTSVEFKMCKKRDDPNISSPADGDVTLGDRQIWNGTYVNGYEAFLKYCNQFDKVATTEAAGQKCDPKKDHSIDKLIIKVRKNTDPTMRWDGSKDDACTCTEIPKLGEKKAAAEESLFLNF